MDIKKIILNNFGVILKEDNGSSYYNVDLHIHTPASKNDYYFQGKKYNDVSNEFLIDYGIKENFFTENQAKYFKNAHKDDILAELLVYKALKEKLNLIAITDHNTIEFYEKVKLAKDNIGKRKKFLLEIIPAVELSVYGGEHVIALFSPNNFIEQWIELKRSLDFEGKEGENLLATTRSLINTLEIIKKIGGITYLPHINSRNIKGETLNKIFSCDFLDIACTNKKHFVDNFIKKRKKQLAIITDSDAHDIEDIGNNFVVMKQQYPSFESLQECINSPNLRIFQHKNIEQSDNHIIGLCIKGGFLLDYNKEWQVFSFNKDLNCIVGGRGVGKSTVVSYLVGLLKLKMSAKMFEFLSSAELVLIYFQIANEVFCLKFKVGNREGKKHWMHDASKELLIDIRPYVSLFKINKARDKNYVVSNNNNKKEEIIKKIYPEIYTQTEIYKIANNPGMLTNYLDQVIMNHTKDGNDYSYFLLQLKEIEKLIRAKIHRIYDEDSNIKKEIKLLLQEFNKVFDEKEEIIVKYIKILNKTLEGKMEIFQRDDNKDSFIFQLVKNYKYNSNNEGAPTNYDKNIIVDLFSFFEKACPLSIFLNLIEKNFDSIIKQTELSLDSNYFYQKEDKKYSTIDLKNIIMNEVELLENLEYILYLEIKHAHRYNLTKRKAIDIKFNVNSFKDITGLKKIFKPLGELSYGQKNVALLTLILEGFTALGLNSPLIVDQPEDQLDNAYISEHLVKNLRQIKGKRQIILVTHNPNIPISGDAENVFCLKSNGESGWIDKKGSIDKKAIVSFIIQYLEGGEEALSLRLQKYNNIVND